MMTKLGVVAAAVVVLGCGVGLGQAPTQTDSQTLKDILTEMRALHNDVRLGQTTQILLTEMEVQRGVVDKAQEKRDDARNRASQLQMTEKQFAAQIAQNEESAKSMTLDPARQKQLADQTQMMKMNMANFKSQEDDAASAQQDAETQLRKEQETLDGIQEQLNDVVKKLQPTGK
jgi:predicted  nucleic acid-binding Zn-ribbon protein